MNNSKFIVFEGCDGSGKSTQINNLNYWLQSQGIKTWVTQEPGGCPDLSTLRDIFLRKDIESTTELFLILSDRSHHITHIERALNDNVWVLCDRFSWSTLAYQGYGDGLDLLLLTKLNDLATQGLKPDLTILLDVDPDVGLMRKRQQVRHSKIELRGLEYHNRVREGYLKIFEDTLYTRDSFYRLFYCKNKNTGKFYSSNDIFQMLQQTFPFSLTPKHF